ncbi:molybdenum cofactor synthesis protein cinnamon [Culicoides brevitarsis]|uniref:molybdenum cofactor synthesis protein cinnamon n=1 Tax=Culicoides brevitarsis TaxID=469753 RepID=UPI00307B2E08
MSEYEYVVLTVSDSCYHGSATDKSGPALEELLKQNFGATKILRGVVPDEASKIIEVLLIFADEQKANVIITTGGTGFGPRDVTPEATRQVIYKEAPQLAYLMIANQMSNLGADKKNKMVALSRAVCGIRNQTLIINMPGSVKAVTECFEAIKEIIPHAVQLIVNDLSNVKSTHEYVQSAGCHSHRHHHHGIHHHTHVCPNKTNTGAKDDRNSEYPMIEVDRAQDIIFENTNKFAPVQSFASGVDIPPFRASIKDGYAVKASGGKGVKKVLGYINAGNKINTSELKDNECFKINTGAPVPANCDAIVQIEDTKLIKEENGIEKEVEILIQPTKNLDIRDVGTDLKKATKLFAHRRPLSTVEHAILASVGQIAVSDWKPRIAVFSTGDELLTPESSPVEGKIFDSNTTMITGLLKDFGFDATLTRILCDTKEDIELAINEAEKLGCHAIISSGGVSMGDKDYIKPMLLERGFNIKFGRVNMKPGKPMTFGFNSEKRIQFYGLPGNPVSAFVTFHLFVLPGLRKMSADEDEEAKVRLPIITVELLNEKYVLDSRPEYARALIVSKNGKLYAEITGNQISSRLMSVMNADVLLHLPGATEERPAVTRGTILKASVLKHDFISRYE